MEGTGRNKRKRIEPADAPSSSKKVKSSLKFVVQEDSDEKTSRRDKKYKCGNAPREGGGGGG